MSRPTDRQTPSRAADVESARAGGACHPAFRDSQDNDREPQQDRGTAAPDFMRPTSFEKPPRRHDLDWLRVLVILNLVPLHAAWLMTFVPGGSALPQGSEGWWTLVYYVSFFSFWHMPLLFFVAGISTASSLNARSAARYLAERIQRLLVPLVFFMVFLGPVMVYFMPAASDQRSVSDYLFHFWPERLMNLHRHGPGGRPAMPGWGHLWFVAYLLVICVATLPLLLWLKRSQGVSWRAHLAEVIGKRWALFLAGVPFAVIRFALAPQWPMFQQHDVVGDWTYLSYNLAAFVLGGVLGGADRFRDATQQHASASLVVAIVSSALVLPMRYHAPAFSTPAYTAHYLLYAVLSGFNTWFWMVALLGLAGRFLSHSNGFLRYFNRASYPFYILHLVPMSAIGFYLVEARTSAIVEFLILTLLSLTVTVLAHELLVRRTHVTRFLFGMKEERVS